MPKPLIGLSMMLEKDFLAASLPLFESAMVEVVEWSPDIGWSRDSIPQWAHLLLGEYSENGRLLGHGVQFSPLNAGWTSKDDRWIDNLRGEIEVRKVLHFSEHFGCANSPDFVASAPLPVPYTRQLVKSSGIRLQRLQDAVQTDIGLENLALAFSLQDVREQGAFLEELLQPVKGFLLLDLHNLYCQMINFDIGAEEILGMYPLHRVRELHVSGGSWSSPSSPITNSRSALSSPAAERKPPLPPLTSSQLIRQVRRPRSPCLHRHHYLRHHYRRRYQYRRRLCHIRHHRSMADGVFGEIPTMGAFRLRFGIYSGLF